MAIIAGYTRKHTFRSSRELDFIELSGVREHAFWHEHCCFTDDVTIRRAAMLLGASVVRGHPPSTAAAAGTTQSLLLTESQQAIGGPPSLMDKLTAQERDTVLKQGRRKVLNRGQTLFSQGARHDGIFLIESGRIRVFYTSPLGREITLAYWHVGNFVGWPEVFGGGVHQCSGVAATTCAVVQLPGKELRTLATEIPSLAIGLIEGLTFK